MPVEPGLKALKKHPFTKALKSIVTRSGIDYDRHMRIMKGYEEDVRADRHPSHENSAYRQETRRVWNEMLAGQEIPKELMGKHILLRSYRKMAILDEPVEVASRFSRAPQISITPTEVVWKSPNPLKYEEVHRWSVKDGKVVD